MSELVSEGGVHASVRVSVSVRVSERKYFIGLCYWSLRRLRIASPDRCN